MLLACPECEHKVSDRARACPSCGFPIAEHVQAQALADAKTSDRSSRVRAGEVDCVRCEARGFHVQAEQYAWCRICEHTGRVTLCRSDRGFYAVTREHVDAFVAGQRDDGDEQIVFLGAEAPAAHRYPAAGKRVID